MQNNFLQRKQDVLSKDDKSSKSSWDMKIIGLCEKINGFDEYYTTSSCAGRVVIMIDQDKKEPGLFLKVWHDLINLEELKKDLDETKESNIKFKQEPCILHVACDILESANKLYDKAKLVGWKKSGIIASDKRFIVELNSTERLEFPIVRDGKLLVDDEFLKVVVEKSNNNLEKCWKKIESLKKNL